ncbi:AbrB family transcriptional regulator [Candidatus Methylomirabilis lanthanidiphila]|uniref:AbrB family transcriptional regulator n=1 Tax=Candidatus Methylomirabilis lanthanidiphila TaxID=2211376 RepID=A0A564ZJV0_9BACT|nr:AbrB/MazE/SpoVT family DNA-binding domain-containing protein [Candidatus Methylomirabilis lanthanidiphila]VUZ85584.1 AbrB family transcriptional regulator [Candidatus Methylomirabilis lanthanidiphila]
MSMVKIKNFAQVTIPAAIRRKAHIEEGDYVDIRYQDNVIVMVPKRVSDRAIDWDKRFDDALSAVRNAAAHAGITEKDINEAVKKVRQRPRM